MGSKTYVCALCSQDFTRKYSARLHNMDLHHGQGKIVRMIDYVIGRIAGKYKPANPLAYRSRYKQQASAPTRFNGKVFSSPMDTKVSIAHDSFQLISSRALPYSSEYYPSDQESNNNSDQPFFTVLKSGYTTKFEEIE